MSGQELKRHMPQRTAQEFTADQVEPENCPDCCGANRYSRDNLKKLGEDAYGVLYQCARCGRYREYDTTYAICRDVDGAWARKYWSELESLSHDCNDDMI